MLKVLQSFSFVYFVIFYILTNLLSYLDTIYPAFTLYGVADEACMKSAEVCDLNYIDTSVLFFTTMDCYGVITECAQKF